MVEAYTPQVLVVDDEPDIRELLADYLTPLCEVTTVPNPQKALRACQRARFHLALVDIRLPGMSGLELVPQLQVLAPNMGIVVITAYAQVDDAVRALRDMDVLDYIRKPFVLRDVQDRIEQALNKVRDAHCVDAGDLVLDSSTWQAWQDGEELSLSCQEFRILLQIMSREGRCVSYDELLTEVWDCEPSPLYYDAVRNAVSRLRKKLGDPCDRPRYIQTVRGIGYRAVD